MKSHSKVKSLSSKILAAFVAVYIVSWVIILTAVYIILDQRETAEHQNIRNAFSETHEDALKRQRAAFASLLEVIAKNIAAGQAIQLENHDYFIQLLQPEYDFLNKNLNVTHLYISDQNSKNVVRLHTTDKYGDYNARHAGLASQDTRDTVSIVSLGKQGSISHRVMKPLYKENQFLGVLELGEEIDIIWQVISKRFDASIFILLNKDLLEKKNWLSGKETFGWEGAWDDFPNYVMSGGSNYKNMLDHQLPAYLQKSLAAGPALHRSENGLYNYDHLPLLESSGREIGVIFFAYPHNLITSKMWKTIRQAIFISAFAMLLGVYACYLLLRPIAYALENHRDELESEIAQQTEKLLLAKEAALHARDEAQIANRAKSEFLSNMSHELRTPLNAIIGFSSVLKDNQMKEAISKRYRDYANDINTSGLHLLMIINDILDISRVEAGELALVPETLSLASVLEECHRMVNVKATDNIIPISHIMQGDDIVIEADHTRLKQILLNLLTNAIKFTNPPGSIKLIGRQNDKDTVQIIVEDDGIGIAEDELPTVMKRFGRAASGTVSKKNAEGTGLGLTLVQDLVALHSGSFEFQSKEGKGTRATVTLPIKFSGDRGQNNL